MNVTIVPAQPGHAEYLYRNLRECDKKFFVGLNGIELIVSAIENSSLAFSGFIDGEIACTWGLQKGTLLDNSAYLWLLTTELVDRHPFVFVRHSQQVIAEMKYQRLHGLVLANFEMSKKWLKWCGFEIKPTDDPRVEEFEKWTQSL